MREHLVKWLPTRVRVGNVVAGVEYSKVGFWLAALRMARNTTTHRALAVVRVEDPVAMGEESRVLDPKIVVPLNPAETDASVIDVESPKGYSFLTASSSKGDAPYVAVRNGTFLMPASMFAREVRDVALEVASGLETIVEGCVPGGGMGPR